MNLQDFFKENPKVALAFSGGVDSAYLLHVAKESGADITAYFIKTQFQPQFEFDNVLKLSKKIKVPLKIIEADILSDENVRNNDKLRCYYCKKILFSELKKAAHIDGYNVIIDGTNASDKAEDRPGMKVLEEMNIKSPLKMCNLTKEEIRKLSKKVGLPTWDKPAYSCLATRIHTTEEITHEILKKVENAEEFLYSLGFIDHRVRISDNDALIQIPKIQIPRFEQYEKQIFSKLEKEFNSISWGDRNGNIIGKTN